MFTIEQIKAAHAKVKSGADFPAYIREITQMGVAYYTTYVRNGHAEFTGRNNEQVLSEPKYPDMTIVPEGNLPQLKADLQIHQQGQTDYLTFCSQAAAAGVNKWVVDTHEMTCIYYDNNDRVLLTETIPQ